MMRRKTVLRWQNGSFMATMVIPGFAAAPSWPNTGTLTIGARQPIFARPCNQPKDTKVTKRRKKETRSVAGLCTWDS